MTDEPTTGELARRMDTGFGDMREDIRDIARRFDQYVPAAVYAAEKAAYERRISDMEAKQDEDRRQRRSDRRLLFSALVAPVLVLLLVAYLASQGLT